MVEASSSTIEPGAAIVLDGLQAKPSLNGRAGTVLDFDDESGRWGVALPKDERPLGGDETKIKVKPENIRLHKKTPPTVPSSSNATWSTIEFDSKEGESTIPHDPDAAAAVASEAERRTKARGLKIIVSLLYYTVSCEM